MQNIVLKEQMMPQESTHRKMFTTSIFPIYLYFNCICILTCLWCVSSVIVGRWKVRGLPAPDGFPQWGANNANNA